MLSVTQFTKYMRSFIFGKVAETSTTMGFSFSTAFCIIGSTEHVNIIRFLQSPIANLSAYIMDFLASARRLGVEKGQRRVCNRL